MKIIPRFKSAKALSQLPQQELRRVAGKTEQQQYPEQSLRRESGSALEEVEDVELFLSSLQALEDDYGSYAPVVAPASALKIDSLDASEGKESLIVPAKQSRTVRPSDLFMMGPGKVSEIAKSLSKRIERAPSSVTPTLPPSTPLSVDSCTSDAETEVWNNLSSRIMRTDVSSLDGELTEIEVWHTLAATFVGKEETVFDGGDDGSNTLCEAVDSSETCKVTEGETMPKRVLITSASGDEEVEVLYGGSAQECAQINSSAVSSQAESSLSSSSHSSASSLSSSSGGILRPPKRAIGRYDPFGVNSDFSLPEILVPPPPLRRVHFDISTVDRLDEKGSALDSLLSAHASGQVSSDGSDDSTASIAYLMEYCCGVQDGLMEV